MGSIVPAAPLPHNHLDSEGYRQMAQNLPSTGEQSRPSRQGFILLTWGVLRRASGVSWTHPVIHKREEGGVVEGSNFSTIAGVSVWDSVTTIYNLFGHRYRLTVLHIRNIMAQLPNLDNL